MTVSASSFHNQTCSRMYHGGQNVYETCWICRTIERCVVYSGEERRRRTLEEWDAIFNACHNYSYNFLSRFHEVFYS